MANQKADREHPGRVIVKNYPPDTSTRDLQIMFEKYGKIDDLYTPKNRENDKPRGFSFIRYRRVEDAEDAIRGMNGRDIDGHKLLVEFAHGRGGGGVGNTPRGGRGPPFRGSRDDSRHKRRSPSPKRYRSRSSSPRDHWRGRDRDHDNSFSKYSEHDECGSHYDQYHAPPTGPHPSHQSQYSRFQDGMMDHPPHEMEHPYQPPRHGGGPPMGGNLPPPPPNMQMGGPPRPQMAGRKTLLNTPNIPHPQGGGRLPQGRQFDDPSHTSHDRSHQSSQFGGPPKQGDRNRDSFPSRDNYGGGPPNQGRPEVGNYQIARGGPPQDSYSNYSRPYYDDQYKLPPSQHSLNAPQSYQDLSLPQRESYSSRIVGGREGYAANTRGYDNEPPPSRQIDEYYSSNDFSGPSGSVSYQRSEYRDVSRNTSGPPQSSASYESREYSGGFGGDQPRSQYGQSSRPSEGYKDDYSYDAPHGNYSNQQGSHPPPSQPSPGSSRRPYDGQHGGGGYPPQRSEGMMPTSTRKNYEHSENNGRYYSTQQSPQRRETRFSSGHTGPGSRVYGVGGGQEQPYSSKSNPGGGYSSTSQSSGDASVRVGPPGGQTPSGYSSYSMSSYTTGYGSQSSSTNNQRSSSLGGGGSGAVGGGKLPSRGIPSNTGFVQSQSYTKPGPPF